MLQVATFMHDGQALASTAASCLAATCSSPPIIEPFCSTGVPGQHPPAPRQLHVPPPRQLRGVGKPPPTSAARSIKDCRKTTPHYGPCKPAIRHPNFRAMHLSLLAPFYLHLPCPALLSSASVALAHAAALHGAHATPGFKP